LGYESPAYPYKSSLVPRSGLFVLSGLFYLGLSFLGLKINDLNLIGLKNLQGLGRLLHTIYI
ncbi:hypothetical protein, partial [Pedobacter miscanthi]|uniref:hypothetical protein n=1 Tax=Pedobacter miscanthi TaxID=2259170 RepID=UPI00292EC3F0